MKALPRWTALVVGLAGVLAAAGATFAQATGETADLASTFVHRIDGARSGDYTGDFASNAGDLNGDGREDVIVGAWGADPLGRKNAGAAYIVMSSAAKHVRVNVRRSRVIEIRGSRKGAEVGLVAHGIGDINATGAQTWLLAVRTPAHAGVRTAA